MEDHPLPAAAERERPTDSIVPETIEPRTASAFTVAGGLLIASLVVPVGLSPLSDSAWVAGLVLVGLAVVAVATGLVGVYPRVSGRHPRVAAAGLISAAVAGIAAIGLLGLASLALIGEGAFGFDIGTPMSLFVVIALTMTGGFALGFLSFGLAGLVEDRPSRHVGALLFVGGLLLLVPVVGELLHRGVGIGPPGWILFPVIGLVALDLLVLGYSLSDGT